MAWNMMIASHSPSDTCSIEYVVFLWSIMAGVGKVTLYNQSRTIHVDFPSINHIVPYLYCVFDR